MKINWFWAHRRNTSLHHMSLFVRGLKARGFSPEVNFFFDNQIYVGQKSKGCYIFYDRDQMDKKYKDIQKDIEGNINFASDFKRKQDLLFKDLFDTCSKIENTDLQKAKRAQLLRLLIDFKKNITSGPIITVQLWGIEACWDKDYFLTKEVMAKTKDFDKVKGLLTQSTKESVAFIERKSLLRAVIEIKKGLVSNKRSINSFDDVKDKRAKMILLKHIKDFEWVNSEYVSNKWDEQRWIEVINEELKKDSKKELQKLVSDSQKTIMVKENLIRRLKLSKKAKHVLDALNAFVSERDWAKGKYCYALSKYDLLLDEMGDRLDLSKEDILHYDIDELLEAMKTGKKIDVKHRKEGYIIISKKGIRKIHDFKKMKRIIKEEGIEEMFKAVEQSKSFKGVIACTGKVTGKVRVIDDPKEINDFKTGEIIVTYMTTMEFTPIFKKALGVITDEGSLSSHAAIISREFNLPCIVGTRVATRTLKTGDIVELDADKGIVRILKRA